MVGVMLRIIRLAVDILTFFVRAAWILIKAATGFVLSTLYTVATNPATWVFFTASGVGVMIAISPLVGGLMAVIGGLLTYITAG